MTNIFTIIRQDLRRATSTVMAAIILFGLVVIPSLFTWFNVIASWDPFANTRDLKVAVASTDEGYVSDLAPLRINVGDQVLSALRANDQLDWVITSKDQAIEGTSSGEYYAAIILPPSFSHDMMTFYSSEAQSARIDLYTNEKLNALAPTIADQGAQGLSLQINKAFAETLTDVALGIVDNLSLFLSEADTQAVFVRLEARVSAASTQLDAHAQTATMFTSLIDATIPLVDSASTLATSSRAAFAESSQALVDGGQTAGSAKDEISEATRALSDTLRSGSDAYRALGESIDQLHDQGVQSTEQSERTVRAAAQNIAADIDRHEVLARRIREEITPALPPAAQASAEVVASRIEQANSYQELAYARLIRTAEAIAEGSGDVQSSAALTSAAIDEARAKIDEIERSYTTDLLPHLDELADSLQVLKADVADVRAGLNGVSSSLGGSSDSVKASLQSAREKTSAIAATFTDAAAHLRTLEDAIEAAAAGGDLSALSEVINSDPEALAHSIADPIAVDRVAVFPVVSFGAGMAPLYTALSLWVGALLMTVTVRVDVPVGYLPARRQMTSNQEYLGRYGIFAILGLLQSTLVTAGLVAFVDVEARHPALLILAGWLTSLVFTMLIYSFVATFGNAGKALAVLLLVIQISAAGGAYPLELLPTWFQKVSPFLPATHAIDAMRSAIAGTFDADFWWAAGGLAVFIVPALILGLFVRRPLIAFNRNLIEALESTKLM